MPNIMEWFAQRNRIIFVSIVILIIALIGVFLWRSPSPGRISNGTSSIGTAMEAYDRGDFEAAEPVLRHWADRGDPVAQFGLGRMYGSVSGISAYGTKLAI
jgi:hypothetical protein